jgi:hypothetical protein
MDLFRLDADIPGLPPVGISLAEIGAVEGRHDPLDRQAPELDARAGLVSDSVAALSSARLAAAATTLNRAAIAAASALRSSIRMAAPSARLVAVARDHISRS